MQMTNFLIFFWKMEFLTCRKFMRTCDFFYMFYTKSTYGKSRLLWYIKAPCSWHQQITSNDLGMRNLKIFPLPTSLLHILFLSIHSFPFYFLILQTLRFLTFFIYLSLLPSTIFFSEYKDSNTVEHEENRFLYIPYW